MKERLARTARHPREASALIVPAASQRRDNWTARSLNVYREDRSLAKLPEIALQPTEILNNLFRPFFNVHAVQSQYDG